LLEGLYTDFSTRTQFLLKEIEYTMNVHAGTLVEMQRTGQILSIHAQAYLALAAPIELIKGMPQQRKTDAAFAPRTAHRERTHPSEIRVIIGIGVRAAEIDTSNFRGASIHGKEP
jgi:hypothetical protein